MPGTVASLDPNAPSLPLGDAAIPGDLFARMRRDNLARWPTGARVDVEEAAAFHKTLPAHKRLPAVLRRAVAEGRCLTQPRGGFATLEIGRAHVCTLVTQFSFAVIFEGVAARAKAGNAAGENAADVAHLAINFAKRAAALAQQS